MYVDTEIAGVKSKIEIGRLVVESVCGEEISLCKVSKPSVEIKEYMNNGIDIIVESM